MADKYNPALLVSELIAAGVAKGSFTGCRSASRPNPKSSEEVLEIVDWVDGHPTPPEKAAAEIVLTDHDNTKSVPDVRLTDLEACIDLAGIKAFLKKYFLRGV